ncbi:bile acid:sodium symporter family protein [Halocatena pleomorpha]|uniref:Bile acid:sodium symporter family protein n=1 Tax=Halocatena pleomorpha TaxID=1785090 RepID=A0A3P3RMF4_9EURY|nr:bile acid:sodium symporter family protein [Halocatena pleomorpha]RRJ33573.1 bile acid:sodium symporter family protein [Halocatena pleomorpha]
MRWQASFRSIGAFTSKYFVVWVAIVVPIALYSPQTFTPIAAYITPLLGIIMLGMGLTLTPADFRRVGERPRDVFVGAMSQWFLMPTFAVVLVGLLGLPDEVGLGLLLLGVAPGGTASNVMTYLGKGDVALSVTITSVTTLAAPLAMPAWIVVLAGESVSVTFGQMAGSIVQIVLLPVIVGVVLRVALDRYTPTVASIGLSIFPAISVVTIVGIVAAIVAVNTETILTTGGMVFLAVVLHNALGLAGGYAVGHASGMDVDRARACAFEVGLQNSGLAVALAGEFFGSPAVALIPALFSVWHNVSGPALATLFVRRSDDSADHVLTPSD